MWLLANAKIYVSDNTTIAPRPPKHLSFTIGGRQCRRLQALRTTSKWIIPVRKIGQLDWVKLSDTLAPSANTMGDMVCNRPSLERERNRRGSWKTAYHRQALWHSSMPLLSASIRLNCKRSPTPFLLQYPCTQGERYEFRTASDIRVRRDYCDRSLSFTVRMGPDLSCSAGAGDRAIRARRHNRRVRASHCPEIERGSRETVLC